VSDLVVAANRGPVSFVVGDDGEPQPRHGAGGLAPSLASALAGSGATWVAAALGDGDRVVARSGPVEVDGISLRLLELPEEVHRTAYNVVANGTLWFLQHGLFERPRRPSFDRHWYEAWEGFRAYNTAFAAAIAESAAEQAVVLVHDYHLGLCGAELARLRPDLRTVHFTHTPWCEPGDLSLLPAHALDQLLTGMGGFGACGFHTDRWASAFRRCAEQLAGSKPAVFASPLGVDAARLAEVAASPECVSHREALLERAAGRRLIVRSDRVELSKNLVRGFRAFGELLEQQPRWREQVVFVALSYGSREQLPEYLAYRNEAEHVVHLVNDRFGTPGWTPVVFEVADDLPSSVAALTCYDVLLVNPLRDGLNLVAKEGPVVNGTDGVLALSREAGAFDELAAGALEVHPYDLVQTAATLDRALAMEHEERRERAAALREAASARTPATWLDDLVAHASRPGSSDLSHTVG
jgi:trehalose 6-phosphate synthase